MFPYRTYLGCLVLSFLITLLVTPWVMRLANRLGAVDQPVNRKIHDRTVPRLGGIALFLGMWIPVILVTFYDNLVVQEILEHEKHLFMILLGGSSMLVIGVADDLRGLNAKWKLAVQLPVAIILVAGGVRFQTISFPFLADVNLGVLGPFVSVLWLVGVTNAVNLIDGIDGLASGVAYLICMTIGLMALWTGNVLLLVVMLAMGGACLGFLRYNLDPARIFLGDSGSLFLGMTLAVASTLGSAKEQVGGSLLLPLILLGYPIGDTLLSMARRYLRGKPIFAGDANHIHHRLLYRGLDHKRVCLVIYAVCLGFCLWSLAIAREHMASMIAGTVLVLVVAIVGAYYLGYLRYLLIHEVAGYRNHYKAAFHFAEMIKAKLSSASTRADLVELLRTASEEFAQPSLEVQVPGSRLGAEISFEKAVPNSEGEESDESFPALVQDCYTFDNTGLVVKVCARMASRRDQLTIEKRRLFGEICEAANRRLVGMLQAVENEDLRVKIEAPLKARHATPNAEHL